MIVSKVEPPGNMEPGVLIPYVRCSNYLSLFRSKAGNWFLLPFPFLFYLEREITETSHSVFLSSSSSPLKCAQGSLVLRPGTALTRPVQHWRISPAHSSVTRTPGWDRGATCTCGWYPGSQWIALVQVMAFSNRSCCVQGGKLKCCMAISGCYQSKSSV